MDFKRLTLNDIPLVSEYFRKYYDGSSDMTIGGTFIWRDYYGTEIALFGETLVLRETRDNTYGFPLGDNSEEVIRELGEVEYSFLTEKNRDLILKIFPDSVVSTDRDYSDYVYEAEKMISLSGKSLSGQRNHISRFKREYENFSFEEITEENIDEAFRFFEEFEKKTDKMSESAVEDRKKTFEVLKNFSEYKMVGAMLKVNGRVIGASVGEIMADTLIVHIEKAFYEYKGAYPMLTNLFNRRFASDLAFVNREDDAGDEGLRKNKLSYNPIKLINKYNVLVKR